MADDDDIKPDDDGELMTDEGGSDNSAGGDGSLLRNEEDESPLRRMMSQYFLEYASYVIKDRAIPDIDDGLKPVQRRILHALHDKDDASFHKVANIVGHTMQYHPHGDSSIYDALVTLANKEYFIEKQGNFGNIFTGDGASAARYIECRLSPLAREVLFNPELTEFIPTYDSRNKEPVTLPAKVPVLLMQGTEGIAVGMSTRILSHNFGELLDAQIRILNDKPFRIYPDFFHGGIMDVTEYDNGNGKIRLRALIEQRDAKTLVVREVPANVTTESVIASIEDMAQKGKVKIASIDDYTSEHVEIEIKLPRGADPDRAIKALYAYTQCEVSISCNCLVIKDNRPAILDVKRMLEHNTAKLMADLRRELELHLAKLEDQFHTKTLAQIFIENRIYKRIEECEVYEEIFTEIHTGLAEFRELLRRDVTDEDIEKLLQIAIRRISLFDINKNRQDIERILLDMEETRYNLDHLREFTINYIKAIRDKYAHLYPRRTRIENMEEVDVREVALVNVKVGLDKANGYIGTAVKSEDNLLCTEFDKIVILGNDGVYKVIPIPEKIYVGSVCAVMKLDKEQVYSMIYRDRKSKMCYAKRFRISSFIMDKEYQAVPKGARVEKFFDRYGIVLRCEFPPSGRQRESHVDLEFEEIQIRGATARGFKIDNKIISKFLQLKRGTEQDPNAPFAQAEPEDDPESRIPVQDTLKLHIPQPPDGQEAARLPEINQPQTTNRDETLFKLASAWPAAHEKRAKAKAIEAAESKATEKHEVKSSTRPARDAQEASPKAKAKSKSTRPKKSTEPSAKDTEAENRFRINEQDEFELE